MTEPPTMERPPTADAAHDQAESHHHPRHEPSPFAPIFALVNNTSTRTTHHPHVRYIFSDDDPDILTEALAELSRDSDASTGNPSGANRAMILDLEPDSGGGYNIAWASSLSSSWAVLDAQLSQISPAASDRGSSSDHDAGDGAGRIDRLMLRIEGVESGALGSEGELSGEASRHGSGSASAGGSGHHDRDRVDAGDYAAIADTFERRMTTLRKIVDAGEERRRKIAEGAHVMVEPTPEAVGEGNPADGSR